MRLAAFPRLKGEELAKPNYSYEKRQRDLAKKKKQEEKRARKMNKGTSDTPDQDEQAPGEVSGTN